MMIVLKKKKIWIKDNVDEREEADDTVDMIKVKFLSYQNNLLLFYIEQVKE